MLGPIQDLGPVRDRPVATATRDGQLALTWLRPAPDGGVDIVRATRASIFAAFEPPTVLATTPPGVRSVQVATNLRGETATHWVVPGTDADTDAGDGSRYMVQVALRGPAGAALEPQTVELPHRPGTVSSIAGVGQSAVAIGADGAVAVTACAGDDEGNGFSVWLRTREGAIAAPQRALGCGTTSATADALGTILVASHGPQAAADRRAETFVVRERRPGAAAFDEGTVLSPPDADTFDGAAPSGVLLTPAGHAIAFWNTSFAYPSTVEVVTRAPGGPWTGPVSHPTWTGWRAGGAVSEAGDAALVWDVGGERVGGIYRRGPAAFAPGLGYGQSRPLTPARNGPYPVAVDALGTTVVLRPHFENGLSAVLRFRNGVFAQEITVQPPDRVANHPALAMDGLGNGTFAWTVPNPSLDDSRLYARPYSLLPPQLSAVAVTGALDAVKVTLNEPARLVVESRAGRKVAKQSVTAPAGKTRIALTLSVRTVLRRKSGRLAVRARDAGPVSSTVRPKMPRRPTKRR